jgi:Fur family ferric uptake transcriptional regulator
MRWSSAATACILPAVTGKTSTIEQFQAFLKQEGQKLTQQRELILNRVMEIDEHFSAEELFELLRNDNSGISKATVYRTLSLLVDADLLDALDFERGHMLYERHAGGEHHHDHLICITCKRIFEFHNDEIERLQVEVAKRYDFEMVSHTHQIYGVCGRCRRQGAEVADQPGRKRRSRRSPRIRG